MSEDRFADLDQAKRDAMDYFKLYRNLDVADSVVVCDETGKEYMRIC